MSFVANNVPGNASATTSSGFVVTATATASASSNVSQAVAYTQALALAESIAQSSAQNQANIMDQTIAINDSPAVTPDTITLYYNYLSTTETTVDFLNNMNTYTGISNRYMKNKDGTTNGDLLTYFGYRTPGNASIGIPSLFCETIIIKTEDGDFISGLANYLDEGSGGGTTTPFENFAVMCANGKFAGYKNIKVTYFADKSRIVTITN
jgi:hypothetical protein